MIAARGWFSKTALSFDMMFGDPDLEEGMMVLRVCEVHVRGIYEDL